MFIVRLYCTQHIRHRKCWFVSFFNFIKNFFGSVSIRTKITTTVFCEGHFFDEPGVPIRCEQSTFCHQWSYWQVFISWTHSSETFYESGAWRVTLTIMHPNLRNLKGSLECQSLSLDQVVRYTSIASNPLDKLMIKIPESSPLIREDAIYGHQFPSKIVYV